MKFSEQSERYISFFLQDFTNCNFKKTPREQNEIDTVFSKLYHDIHKSDKYITYTKKMEDCFRVDIMKINLVHQIPKPALFRSHSIPSNIKKAIDTTATYHLQYKCTMGRRKITIHFILTDATEVLDLEKYEQYVHLMLIWLNMIKLYSISGNCAERLNIFVYFASIEKKLPDNQIDVIGTNHVNTAITTSCTKIGDIIIYRREEWFKVFIHETFHTLGLDFSTMNLESLHKDLHVLFPIKSSINAYEAYAETWARILNVLFCSYNLLEDKDNKKTFLLYADFGMQLERIFTIFQCVKVLGFMGLKYENLHTMNQVSETMRLYLYKENTNIFAYYVLTAIFLSNYSAFLKWCDVHNTSLLGFTKTHHNLNSFEELIKYNYNNSVFLERITCMEKFLKNIRMRKAKGGEKKTNLLKTMRMSIMELI